jgi:predicted transglutaminase-like cysteine proteinase
MQRGVLWNWSFKAALPFIALIPIIIGTACSSVPTLNSPDNNRDSGFEYNESQQAASEIFQQWGDVLKRHAENNLKGENPACIQSSSNNCRLHEWKEFLTELKGKPAMEQIMAVNDYVNQKTYKLDRENYGMNDYWATPMEFLYKGGDCEDYAITKLLSLLQLGFAPDSMRMVVLMDTKLKTPHAALALYTNDDILILDNQTQDVVSHQRLSHYVPIYSINEKGWWIHASN